MRRATNLHRVALEFNNLRAVDVIALALGYGVILAAFSVLLVSVFDWIDGRQLEALGSILAALGWARGATL